MKSLLKHLFFHITTTLIVLFNSILKPAFIYFIISFLSVIIIVLFYVGTDNYSILNVDTLNQSMINHLKENTIISTTLSTIACFLVGLYYLVSKPTKSILFITILWISVSLTIFIFTITLVEIDTDKNIFNSDIKFYITYFLLGISFILTMFTRIEFNQLKIIYNNQLTGIKSKFMKESEYNGSRLKI